MINTKLLNAAISAALALGASAFLSTSVLAQEVRETDDELLL